MEKDLEKIAREFKESLDKYWELLVKIIEHKEVESPGAVSISEDEKPDWKCEIGKVGVYKKERKVKAKNYKTGDTLEIPF